LRLPAGSHGSRAGAFSAALAGPNGGYQLARPADQISLLDVLEAVDGPIRGQAPLDTGDSGPLNRKLEAVCNQTADQVREHLARVPVSELVTGKGRKSARAAGRR
jgi:DNA-binding IscR family transcriptional regulator